MNKRRFLKSLFGIAGAAIAVPAAAKLPTAGPWDGMSAGEVLDCLTAPIEVGQTLTPWSLKVEVDQMGRHHIVGMRLGEPFGVTA